MDDELKGWTIRERMLPGRINTRAIASFGKDEREHGNLCVGCGKIVPHPFAICSCPEWKEWWEKQNATSRRV